MQFYLSTILQLSWEKNIPFPSFQEKEKEIKGFQNDKVLDKCNLLGVLLSFDTIAAKSHPLTIQPNPFQQTLMR